MRCDANGNNPVPIGVTSKTYTVRAADIGSTIRVQVTATNAGGSTPASSAATAVVGILANTGAPTISGTAVVGQLLTGSRGSWSGATPITYAYQWLRCDASGNNPVPIGPVGAQYTVRHADVGSRLAFKVTATNAVGSASATSAVTAVVTAT